MYTLNELDVDRNERHQRLLAAAAESRFQNVHAPARSWQRRLCTQIGHWLVSAGRRLETDSLRRRPSGAAPA